MNKKIIISIFIIVLLALSISYLMIRKYRHISPAITPAQITQTSATQNVITNKDINPDGYDDETNY